MISNLLTTIAQDSMAENLSAADSASFQSVAKLVQEISHNTDQFYGIGSTVISVLSITASFVTIIGLIAIFLQFRSRQISKKCQKRIILDLFRHFMTNNAIIEVLRSKMEKSNSYRPSEGSLTRFATLESDTDLGRFSVNDKNYEDLHHLSLRMRNYNLLTRIADNHFQDPSYSKEQLNKELNDIFFRAVDISDMLLELSRVLNIAISENELRDYVITEVSNLMTKRKNNQNDDEFTILPRDPEDETRCFYDKKGLGEEFNKVILYHSRRY